MVMVYETKYKLFNPLHMREYIIANSIQSFVHDPHSIIYQWQGRYISWFSSNSEPFGSELLENLGTTCAVICLACSNL